MNSKAIIAIAVAAIVLVGGAAAFVVMNKDKDKDTTYDESQVRLRIYGNANGDDVIDSKDIDIINKIIDDKNEDWKKDYYFADANHDGKIDSTDVDTVNKILKKESVKMWYESAFSTKDHIDGSNDHIDAYVNYPIGQKVGCEYSDVDILSVLGKYDCFKATSTNAQSDYGNGLYPGISTLPTLGKKDELTLESLADKTHDGTINTFIQWTGGTSTNYIWDKAVQSGLADELSIVMVTVQGEHCVNGALMLACMFGDQTLSDKYVKWYDGTMKTLSKITDDMKKTAVVVKMFQKDNATNLTLYNQYQSPALWYSKIINFTDLTAGKLGFTNVPSAQSLGAAIEGLDFVLCQTKHTPTTVNQEQYNTWCKGKLDTIFGAPDFQVYKDHKIYTMDFSLMPFFGGPAGCLLLASQIYGDSVISYADASAVVNDYCSKFMPPGSSTANGMSWGYTYTGWSS